ncbi:chorismate--pyruvate lyase family protein [Cribrihabitans pelagius]|uniref:chorismate--pyruvate lyase family protein n=1 Tax=Cribrihabitans pelagius TaxID=1765746 RepID=UPI003B5A09BB
MAGSGPARERLRAAAEAAPGAGPVRQRFGAGIAAGSSAAAWAEAWLRMLLVQDGSATLICETIADGPVKLEVLHQKVTTSVPRQVRAHLPGSAFIERQVCMSHAGQVMMDNLSYVALERLDPEVRRHLEQGLSPIGYIFDVKRTCKRPVACPEAVLNRLWQRAGVPDPASARSYVLEIEATSSMLITEVYRAGMCFGLPQS